MTLPRLILGGVTVAAVAVLAACGRERSSPEARIRMLVAGAERAAERKDLDALRALVSERYRDEHDNDREGVLRILAYHFLRHRLVHVVTATTTVDVQAPDRAEIVVFAGLASRAGDSFQDALLARADVYRFDLRLAADAPGDWTVEGAAWRPADLADLGRLRTPAGD